jgi:hypothetical protein
VYSAVYRAERGAACLRVSPPSLTLLPALVLCAPLRPRTQAIKFIMKHGKSDKDIRALRQEIEILRSLQARTALRPFGRGVADVC